MVTKTITKNQVKAIRKGWERTYSNKLKGAYGETDFVKKKITINKKLHKKNKEPIISTIIHEEEHRKHPKMHEKTVRKREKKLVKKLSKKVKSKLRNKYAKSN
jgi:hypothetical protein